MGVGVHLLLLLFFSSQTQTRSSFVLMSQSGLELKPVFMSVSAWRSAHDLIGPPRVMS